LLTALLIGAIAPLTASAADGIDITDKFTDPAFRAAVREIIGEDVILDTDVAELTSLNVCYKNIKSLAGLEYFISLEELICYGNELASLPALPSSITSLQCSGNKLTSLPKLPSGLRFLNCSSNQLTSLDVAGLPLTFLDCTSNQLTSLDVTGLPLQNLNCSSNQLTGLNVTGLSLLSLNCTFNNMKSTADVIGYAGMWDVGLNHFTPQNPPPVTPFWSTWPAPLQWILEYILFGWLWMGWF